VTDDDRPIGLEANASRSCELPETLAPLEGMSMAFVGGGIASPMMTPPPPLLPTASHEEPVKLVAHDTAARDMGGLLGTAGVCQV
jgi:hypothetical protein